MTIPPERERADQALQLLSLMLQSLQQVSWPPMGDGLIPQKSEDMCPVLPRLVICFFNVWGKIELLRWKGLQCQWHKVPGKWDWTVDVGFFSHISIPNKWPEVCVKSHRIKYNKNSLSGDFLPTISAVMAVSKIWHERRQKIGGQVEKDDSVSVDYTYTAEREKKKNRKVIFFCTFFYLLL